MLRLAPLDDDVMEVGGAQPKGAFLKEFLGNAAAILEQRRLQLEYLRESFICFSVRQEAYSFLLSVHENKGVTPTVDVQSCLRLGGERLNEVS